MHLAFLVYLESRHSHSYRAKVPRWISYVLAILGIIFYGKIEALAYLFFGFLYTQKIKQFGFASPLFRGLQNVFLVSGIIGYTSPLTYLVGFLFFLRNLAGDFRDAGKDKKEGVGTIPVLIGIDRNVKYLHLAFTMFTSCVWWYLSTLSIGWLALVILIEASTYNLTPR